MVRLFAVFAALALSFAGIGSAAAQSSKPWRHGLIMPKTDSGILLMAAERGFFKQVGLNVQIVPIKDDQILLKALIAGELDSFEGGPAAPWSPPRTAPTSKSSAAPGWWCRTASMSTTTSPRWTISRASRSPCRRRTRCRTFSPRARSTITTSPPNAVKFASLGGDLDRYQALVGGVVEAAVVSNEYEPIAAKDTSMLVAPSDAVPNFLRVCLMSTGKMLAEHGDDAAHFLAGEMLGAALRAHAQGRGGEVTQKVINIKPDDPRPAFIYDLAMKHHAIGPTLPIPLDKFDWINQELVKAGSIPKPLDLSKVLDGNTARSRAQALAGMH